MKWVNMPWEPTFLSIVRDCFAHILRDKNPDCFPVFLVSKGVDLMDLFGSRNKW